MLSPTEPARQAPAWYALHTRHQHEKTVSQILGSKGFEILLPVYKCPRRWKDRTKILSLPLFPCYVFLKGGLERRLDILRTPGICDIVSGGGHPIAIPNPEIEAIQKAAGSGLRLEPYPFLNLGDRVTITQGPLTGVQGILVRKKNLYRVVLSVEMLGKAAAVEVDTLTIERLPNSRLRQSAGLAYVQNETCHTTFAMQRVAEHGAFAAAVKG